CERGLFRNEGGTVDSLVSREEFFALQSEKFVEDTFQGSLPQFLLSFVRRKKLSEKEVQELIRIINEGSKENRERADGEQDGKTSGC
ncbi:MAG: BlaI/MecI/CopY family transcriptional regulator, partial [Lachnospiraceae bacterium]|nr:BlaI/MecI/CopY family transcriptional regulator [Lachnospiraceae bacterium]